MHCLSTQELLAALRASHAPAGHRAQLFAAHLNSLIARAGLKGNVVVVEVRQFAARLEMTTSHRALDYRGRAREERRTTEFKIDFASTPRRDVDDLLCANTSTPGRSSDEP